MPTTTVNTPDGKLIDVTHPDGAPEDQIIGYAQQQYALDPSIAYDPTTALGTLGETLKGVPRGVANSLISTGEGLFQLADAGLNLVGLEDVIDDEDEDSVLNLARQGREALNESFLGVDQGYQDSFGTKFGEGLGSFFTFLGPGLLGKVAGLTGKALTAAQLGGAGTLAVGAGAGDQSQRIAQARAQGIDIDPDTEDAAIAIGGAIGLTELAPVERLFKGLPAEVAGQSLAKSIIPRLTNAAKTGGVEAVQELTAGLLQDFTARGLYDPNTPIGESAWDDLTVGGAVGAAADLVVNYAAGRRRQAINEVLLGEEREIRERLADEEQRRREARSAEKVTDAPEIAEEEIDVVNVGPAMIPVSVDGRIEERMAGGNPFRATAIEIANRLGASFPVYETFNIESTGAETTVVMDSQGKQYGPEYADPREAIQLAGALNEQVLEETLEQNNRMIVEESGLDLDEDQTQSLLSLGRQVLGTDRTSYNKLAVDYAAGTTAEEGFADDLTAQQAMDAGLKPKEMTASQRINAARIKKGLPETDRFSLSEVRKALGDNVGRLAEFESGASDVDTLRATTVDGAPVVSVDRDGSSTAILKDRPATAQEKEQARSAGKRAPSRVKFQSAKDARDYAAFVNARKGGAFLPSSDLFGDPDLSQAEFERLLAAKNIEMDYRSPEMQKIAERFTGRRLRRDQSINDLTKEERQLLFYKMRQLPRFNKPTPVPVFELKEYSPAQLRLAVDYLNEQGEDIPQAGLEFRGVPIKEKAYNKLIKRAREIGTPPAPVEVEESQILALPAPDQRRQAMAKAIQDRLAQMNLGDSVVAKLVDRVRSVAVDADGNLSFDTEKEGRGMYSPSAQVLQVSFDSILEEVGPDATDAELERAILGTFNHETIHAIRALDLITQEELELLERASRRYRPSGAVDYKPGETFNQYAARVYNDRDAVIQAEEAIAELIKYGYQDKLIDDRGNAVKIGGKPRTLMRRIVDFFKNMIGFTRGTEAANFSDFLRRLETGEIGARERGEVRTLYRLEREMGAVPERGIVAGAYVEPIEEQKVSDQPVVMEEADIVEDELEDRAPVDVTKRIPEMTEAAQRLQAGEITKQEYANIARELKPVTPYEEVPAPASPADAKAALSTGRGQSPEKAAKYGLPSKQMKRGEDAQLRLDIPSYTNHGTWVVSVHRPKGPSFRAGPVVGYESTGAVTDALFGVEEKAALSMAAGKPKGTIATVRGKWSPMSPQAAKKAADEAISDPAWTQVGMDPFRHSYFYDRDNPSMRVISADEVIQVGPLVLAKNAKTVDALEDEDVLFDRRPQVIFEVAPDPNNTALKQRWQGIPLQQRSEISNSLADIVARKLRAAMKAGGSVGSQLGNWMDDGIQPSFAYSMSTGDPMRLAKAFGYILDQEGMAIFSPKPFSGSSKGSSIQIAIGRKTPEEVDAIYQSLRNIDGIPQISGQTTVGEDMLILLDETMNPESMASAFDGQLQGQYDINISDVYYAFPEKKDYTYADNEGLRREFGENLGERIGDLRSETQRRLEREIERLDGGSRPAVDQDVSVGLEGAIAEDGRLRLTHYSREPISETDPSRAGTGLDRAKSDTPRATYFGITDADVNPYVQESGLGAVENRFLVDPKSIYNIGQDAESLVVKYPDTSRVDIGATLQNLNDAGYIGFWSDNSVLGKVAVVNKPLKSERDTQRLMKPAGIKRSVASREEVEDAVRQNLEAINETQGPPRFSVKASPEAQYIGQNPEAALTPDEELYDAPPESPAVKRLTTGPVREQANGKVFMEATNTGPIGEMLTRFKQFALNRYAGLEKYYQKNPMLRELEADSSAIAAALFSDRSRGILASAIKDGVPVYQNGLTKVVDFSHNGRQYRGLIEVMSIIYNKDVGDLRKIAQAYAMVMRGQYLDKRGDVNPVDAQTRAEILQEVDALTDANGYNPVKDWHDVWMAYNDKTIDFLKATGILNEETAEQWKASSYIPFYRQAQGDKGLPKVAQGVFGDLSQLSSFRRYKGSEKAVDVGLIESVALNLSSAIEMGMKNVAQQRIARDMQALGLARQVPLKKDVPNGVKFKVNGKPVKFEIDDNLIYSSMETLGGGAVTDILTKTLGFPSMILRETITRDPGFMIANLMRDTLSTFTTSGANFVPILDSVKGLADGMNRLERVGVVGGYDYSRDPDNVVKFFTDESNRRGIGPNGDKGSPLGMFKSVWRALGDATTASDAATRNAVYNDVLARTGNEAEAAFQAMEIINFSRRGAHPLARVITAAIPFLNARFQGLDVFVRASTGNYSAVKDPQGTAVLKFATRGLLLAGLTGLYYMLVSDDDQYKEQSDEVRDNNWLIPTSAGVPVRIPIPFEVGLLFKTIPETIVASTFGDKTAPEVRDTIVRGITSTLEINPLGAQAVAPIVEASLNHNFFTGREIVPYYIDQKITGGLQVDAGTTEMGKFVGESLNISPMKVDHVMFGYTGTLGAYILNLVDRGLKSEVFQGEDSVLPPAKSMYQFPLWRRFFGQKEGSGLKEDAYDLYNEISTVVNTVNKLKRDGQADVLNAYIASRRHLLSLKDPVYAVKRKLDLARDQKRKIMNSKLEPDVKRDMIEDIDGQMNEYLKVVYKLKEAADLPFIETTF